MKLFFCVHATPLCLFFLLDSNGTRVATNILAGSHGNMRPAALRVSSSPGRPSPTQDFGTSRSRPLSPVKTSGFSSSMSSQTSPALVNALFERVEQQAEVCVKELINYYYLKKIWGGGGRGMRNLLDQFGKQSKTSKT